jgi:hypothetical protein
LKASKAAWWSMAILVGPEPTAGATAFPTAAVTARARGEPGRSDGTGRATSAGLRRAYGPLGPSRVLSALHPNRGIIDRMRTLMALNRLTSPFSLSSSFSL